MILKESFRKLIIFLTANMVVALAFAGPTTPNTADIPRGQGIAPLPQVVPAPPLQKPTPATSQQQSNVRLVVKQFTLSGNQAIKQDVLLALLTPYLNKEIGMAELNQAVQAITQYYRDEDYFLAQAYLPKQQIRDGKVNIAVLEGARGDLALLNAENLNQDFLSDMAAYRFPDRAIVREHNLVRNVTLINSLPAMRATANLNPGQAIGSSDVEISLEPLPSTGYLAFNTFGNPVTGREQLLAGLSLTNLAGVGDVLNISVKYARANGQKALQVGYARPIHASGTLWRADYSYVDYQLGGPFESLDADGDGHYFSTYLDQPIVRTADHGVTGRMGASFKKVKDEIGVIANNQRNIATVELGLLGDWINPHHRTLYQWGISATAGHVTFRDTQARLTDESSIQTAGGFSKLNLNATRQQYFSSGLSLVLNADYQLSDKNLDSVEKLSIGGINRWRAFSSLPNQADSGFMLGAEFRKNVTIGTKLAKAKFKMFSPYAFVDYGRAKSNQNPLTSNNRIISRQYGLGLDMLLAQNWALNFALTKQERSLEGASNSHDTMLWGQLKKTF